MSYPNLHRQPGGFRTTIQAPDAELLYRIGYVICVLGVFLPLF
jgi:hypothetical protein